MKNIGLLLVFLDLCTTYVEEILMWALIQFENVLCWIHDRFMRVVHEIFHAMSEGKECRFCWGVHITTQDHDEVLNIISCLDSDVHEVTNPVIEGTPM